ncbi:MULTISPECIES: hypothetical protein [unclassified Nocardia]|uniref:hypothetical protein n=1 Tax=unclassified Nocardia TaxID=2637762 RepID=UPI00278C2FCE|nr:MULTISPECIES: hypothetical protein [unclassified Nocardia]
MSVAGIDWKRRADWLDSLTPLSAVGDGDEAARSGGRVHTFSGMNPEHAARKLARILAAEDLQATRPIASSGRSIPTAQPIAVPYNPDAPGGEQGPIPIQTPPPDGETPPVAPTTAPPEDSATAPLVNNPPQQSAPDPTVFEQMYDPGSTAGTPGTQMAPFIPEPDAAPPVPLNPDPFFPPDLTGRQVGDSWTEDWFDGQTRRLSIPEGNGLNTVDIAIVDAEGKVVTTARVARASEGPGYLRWQSDSRGNSTYFETPDPAQGGYGQHFGAGVPTSGAPTAEFRVGPDWATVVTPSYDADGNAVGYDVGTRNEQGLYDNEHTDSLGYRTLTATGRDAQGRLTSEFVGQLGPDGRGWLLDEHGRPAERFLDGNGKPVVISTDPTTGHRTVLFDGGRNVFDSGDNLIGQFVVGSDGRILSGWSKQAWYSRERTEYHRGPFGLLREEIVDPVSGIRGQIRYLGDHTEVSYNDGSVVVFDRDGRIVDTRGFGEKAFAAARNFGRGAKNNALAMLEGISALSGFNDQFNTAAEWLGFEPNLATRAEAGEAFALGIGNMLVADISAITQTAWGAYRSLTGQQSWNRTWDNIWHSALNSYNEKSKFFIGTDWSAFTDNPAETLGSATIGIAASLLPTKGAGRIVHGANRAKPQFESGAAAVEAAVPPANKVDVATGAPGLHVAARLEIAELPAGPGNRNGQVADFSTQGGRTASGGGRTASGRNHEHGVDAGSFQKRDSMLLQRSSEFEHDGHTSRNNWGTSAQIKHATGSSSRVRQRALNIVVNSSDFSNFGFTFKPVYSPTVYTGMANRTLGTQIGRTRFHSRLELRRTIVHEELHHRWYARGRVNHHPRDGSGTSKLFYDTVNRYLRFRGWM